jgi:hypothetical protein
VKRNALLALVCTAALGAAAVPALGAGANHYEGRGTAGLFIGFDVVKKNGQIKKVKNVLWDELRITCNGETAHVSGGFEGKSFKVKNGSFSGGANGDGGSRVTFAGHFIKHNKKAKGTLEVKGNEPHCGSGTINWTVAR